MIVIGGVVFLCIGLALVISCVVTGEDAWASRRWSKTQGEIISCELRRGIGVDGDPLYGINVRYRFVHTGIEWIGMRAYFGDTFLVPAPSALGPRRRMNYKIGEIVNVSYDPASPNDAVLEPGIQPVLLYVLFLGLVFTTFGIIALGIRG